MALLKETLLDSIYKSMSEFDLKFCVKRSLLNRIYLFIKSMNQTENAWQTLMTTKHCFLSITIFLCDICMEVSNCVRNKRQVIHSFFDDRTIKGNRHVLPAMCVSFKTIVSYNIMSHKLVIFSKVYFSNRFW